jgi:hypothetical protein
MAEVKVLNKKRNRKFAFDFPCDQRKTITVWVQYLWRCSDTNLHVIQFFLTIYFGDFRSGSIFMYY